MNDAELVPCCRRPWQRYLAEFLGTFAIVFVGCGAAIVNVTIANGAIGHVGVSLTFGLVVAAMVYALGPISAAHMNPAVTLGFTVARRFPLKHVPAYWASQCVGAVFGSWLHVVLLGDSIARGGNFGATVPHAALTTFGAFGIETVLTFTLMLVVMAVATDRRIPGTVPALAVGATVTFCALFGGPLTGASINPARSLAPALFAGDAALSSLLIYIIAPAAGAVAAALLFEIMRDGKLHARSAPDDLEEAMAQEPGLAGRS